MNVVGIFESQVTCEQLRGYTTIQTRIQETRKAVTFFYDTGYLSVYLNEETLNNFKIDHSNINKGEMISNVWVNIHGVSFQAFKSDNKLNILGKNFLQRFDVRLKTDTINAKCKENNMPYSIHSKTNDLIETWSNVIAKQVPFVGINDIGVMPNQANENKNEL